MFVLIRNLNQTKSMSACGGTVRVIRDRFVTPGYRRCRWKLHPRRWGRRVFSYWRRQRKLRRALHKKAERGSVSEILMRQLASLLQERRPFKFLKKKKRKGKKRKEGPEGNRLSCRVYACVYFFFFFKELLLVSSGLRRVKSILPYYKSLHLCHSKDSRPPRPTEWKRARFCRIWLRLIQLGFHRQDTQGPLCLRTIWI